MDMLFALAFIAVVAFVGWIGLAVWSVVMLVHDYQGRVYLSRWMGGCDLHDQRKQLRRWQR